MATNEVEEVTAVAIQHCDVMEAVAAEVWRGLEVFDDHADTLVERLEAAVSDIGSRLRGLAPDAATAKARVNDGAAEVDTALARFVGAVREVVGDYEAGGDRIEAAAERIRLLGDEPIEALREVAPPIDKGMLGVDLAIASFAKQLETGAQGAAEGLKAATGAVDQARTALDQAHGGWMQAFDSARTMAGARVGAFVQGLAAAADTHARGVVWILNECIVAHNAYASDLVEGLAAGTATVLAPAARALDQGKDALETAARSRADEVRPGVDTVVEGAANLVRDLEGRATAVGALSTGGAA
jgi:hypothetical protein